MINVRFVGAEGHYQSIETQAVRLSGELGRVGAGRARGHLSLLSQDFFRARGLFRRAPLKGMTDLARGMDVVVVVKSSLFREFIKVAPRFREICHEHGALLLSNPCDGPGADAGNTTDFFSEEIADYVLAISRRMKLDLAEKRPADEILLVEHASRLETSRRITPRREVRKVVWENPVHHNPRYDARKAGSARDAYEELEARLRKVLNARGAELVFIDAWRETQSYTEWERIMLDADIAIEAKALGGDYTGYQLQKPVVKVVNYLSLGLPVICDSLPAYRDLGENGRELLFADTLEEWEAQLTRLLDDFELRVRLGEAGWKASQPYHIDNVCKRYIAFFEEILEREGDRRARVGLIGTSVKSP